LDVLRRADRARLDRDVGERLRLAEKRLAPQPLLVRERLFLVDAVVELAGNERPLAAAARAILAAVGQDEALPERRGEDRLAILDVELQPAGLQGHPVHVR